MSTNLLVVEKITTTPKQQIVGVFAALVTVLIWSSYFLSLRIGALTPLTLVELSFFRYAVPGLILLPIFIKSMREYSKVPKIYLFGIVIGSGLPFFLFSAYGMQLTQVAYGSTLIPGTVPLFVTLIAVIIYKQPLPIFRQFGLFGICSGIVAMIIPSQFHLDRYLLLGQGIFIVCAFLWAIFTISIRQSGLSPLKVAALAAFPNGVLITLWIAVTHPELGYTALPVSAVLMQLVVQGILVGIFSGLCFSKAIMSIGAEKTAAIGAATPAIASFLATMMLGETIHMSLFMGMVFVIGGVFIASGVLSGEKAS